MAKRPYGDHKVIFFCVGDGRKLVGRFGANPWELLYSKPEMERIMLLLGDGGKPLLDLLAHLKLDKDNALELLENLSSHKLVFNKEGKFFTTIPVLTRGKSMQLKRYLEPIALREAVAIEKEMGYIKEAVLSMPFSEGFAWDDLAHIIIDALILDLGTLNSLQLIEKEKGIYDLRTDWQKVIPFFGVENDPDSIPNLGVNSNTVDGFGLSFMHSTLFERKIDPFDVVKNERNKQLISILFEKTTPLPHLFVEVGEEPVRSLLQLNWVRRKNDEISLNLPAIRAVDREPLSKLVKKVSEGVAQAVIESIDIIRQSYETLDYYSWLPGIGDYLEIVYHMLMAYTTKELVRRGLLPKIPEELPPNWSVWTWEIPWMLNFP
ncbi:MAG: hypothetical protein AOA65_1820 [Candidatus Bathyarchaeota archaeon BA1]|nr:MAG: hypothetical protein AOA65_1820 [Candidatus Bathyarchaeota archaeon BA1]